jgi:hypothetical protein
MVLSLGRRCVRYFDAQGRADRLVQPRDEFAQSGATVDDRFAAWRALLPEDRMS